MKIKLFLIIFLFFNNLNLLFASDDFFKEELNMMKKNMMSQNFYFNEILFIILKRANHIYF